VHDETLKKVAVLFGEDAVRVVKVLKGSTDFTTTSSWLLDSPATKKQAGLSSTGDSNPTSWKALS